MALMPRIRVQADVESAELAPVLAELSLLAERIGVPNAMDIVVEEIAELEGLYDLVVATFERAALAQTVTVQRHNCPHVAGFEEPSWTACTDAAYDYRETVI